MIPQKSLENLRFMEGLLLSTETVPEAEAMLRRIVSGAAKNCPLELLLKMGREIVNTRRLELEQEASAN